MRMNNKKGSMLVLSYMVIFVLVMLGAAYMVASFNEGLFAERQRRALIAFYIAESGLERAIYDLRQDFINDVSPSWNDGNMNGYAIGPNTVSFYTIPYASTTLNGGSYTAQLKNVAGISTSIWVKSTGAFGDSTQTIQAYVQRVS